MCPVVTNAVGGQSRSLPQAIPTCNCTALDPSYALACGAVNTLQLRYFMPEVGRWKEADFWHHMLALHAIVDFVAASGCKELLGVTTEVHRAFPPWMCIAGQGFDDSGWAVAAYLRAFEATGEASFLDDAITVFDSVDERAWTSYCGGGYCWQPDGCQAGHGVYKNAITSELGLFNSARISLLRNSSRQGGYLDRAVQLWSWLASSGLINEVGLVNDGLTGGPSNNGTNCQNNGETTWTYNQGVVLGGLAALHKASPNVTLLQSGIRIANAVMEHLTTTSGVLDEPSIGDRDQQSFKGIFMLHLSRFATASGLPPESRTAFVSFIRRNADVAAGHARLPGDRYGATWQGPVSAVDGSNATDTSAAAQISAVMLLTAAAVWSAPLAEMASF